jgi:hypothetical protein
MLATTGTEAMTRILSTRTVPWISSGEQYLPHLWQIINNYKPRATFVLRMKDGSFLALQAVVADDD